MEQQAQAEAQPVRRPPAAGTAEDDRPDARWSPRVTVLVAGLALGPAVLASAYRYEFFRENYLLIHTLGEMFSMVVGAGIFALAWNSRRRLDSNYPLVIGVAYLCVAVLDLVHTLAYKGMGVFAAEHGTNLAAQLWISARHVEALSLLVAPLLLGRRIRPRLLLAGYALVAGLLLASIFHWRVFPTCFVEGKGLTAFKKINEYVICLILLGSIALMLLKRRHFDRDVLALVVWSVAITIASELAFTFYSDPYGPANLWGHFLKIVSFYLIYRAVIYTGLIKPHTLLFRNLKISEEALRQARDQLEQRVRERTAELVEVNRRLTRQVEQRRVAQEQLSLERRRLVSLLHMLPGYVSLYDRDCRVRFANHKFLELFGEPGAGTCHEVVRGLSQPCLGCPLVSILDTQTPAEWEWTGSAGRTYHVWGYPFADVDGSRVVLTLGLDVTERKKLQREVLEISELEQQRIGQDLHDTVGQSLTGAAFMTKVLGEKLTARQSPEGAGAAEIEALLNRAIVQTRAVARGLCPVEMKPNGLVTAVHELASRVEGVFGISCRFTHDERAGVTDPVVATHLYRIAQEAVNNALRHARANSVDIALSRKDHALRLAVRDDGVGLPEGPDEGKGMGLRIMRYRADLIGAALEIKSVPGRGTTVECLLQDRGRNEWGADTRD